MSIEAMRKALNYIENTEGELGIKLSCGDALREALAAQPPAAPVEVKPKSMWQRPEYDPERSLIEAVKEMAAPHEHLSAATVQVRPLEWGEGKGELAGQLVWSSGDPWVFWIVKNPNEKYIWCENFNIEGFCPCSPVRGSYDTLDEAKAAAQADYDERIRAAVILNEPQGVLACRDCGKPLDVAHILSHPRSCNVCCPEFGNPRLAAQPLAAPVHQEDTYAASAEAYNAAHFPSSSDTETEHEGCTDEHCEFFEMLWKWFADEKRHGAAEMRANQANGGLSASDFEEMLDEHEANLIPAEPQTVGMRELLEDAVSFANQVAFMDEVRRSPETAAVARRYEDRFKEALSSLSLPRPKEK